MRTLTVVTHAQYNTCYWALRQQGGKTGREAEAALKGTFAADKNELLFSQFGINYSKLPAQFRKGSVVLRCTEACESVNAAGGTVSRARRVPRVLHVDIIGDSFWIEHPDLLK